MKRILLWMVLIILGLVTLGLAQDQIFEKAVRRNGQRYVPDEIIVKFKAGTKEELMDNLNLRHGAYIFRTGRHGRFKRLKIPRTRKALEMVELYKRDPNVEYAEPNYIAHAFWSPNDQYYRYQWHLDNPVYGGINAEEAWDITIGAPLDLVAPGGDLGVDQNNDGYGDGVLQQTFGSTLNSWGYWFYSGTSMAAPHVSAISALLISSGRADSPDEVRAALQNSAKDKGAVGWDSEYGWGLVDAYAALNYSPTPNNPPVANAGGPYTGTEDIAIIFDSSGSSDPDGDSLTYSWDFGDGSTGTGVNPTHIYTAGGTYEVWLTVNDGTVSSPSSTTTATIEVG